MRAWTIGMVATLTLLTALPVTADEAASLESIIVQSASTPEQHKVLAEYYRGKAKDARADVARHKQMSRTYSIGNLRRAREMREHCDKLAAAYEATAVEYEALAAEHDSEGASK
jgi:hypothetical protein